jgi:hypothetical protein
VYGGSQWLFLWVWWVWWSGETLWLPLVVLESLSAFSSLMFYFIFFYWHRLASHFRSHYGRSTWSLLIYMRNDTLY